MVQSFGRGRPQVQDQVLPQEVVPPAGTAQLVLEVKIDPAHLEQVGQVVHDAIAAAVRCGVECGLSDANLPLQPDLPGEPEDVGVSLNLDGLSSTTEQ